MSAKDLEERIAGLKAELEEAKKVTTLALVARDEVSECIRDENPTAYAALQKRWEELQDATRKYITELKTENTQLKRLLKDCAIFGLGSDLDVRGQRERLRAVLAATKDVPPKDYGKQDGKD